VTAEVTEHALHEMSAAEPDTEVARAHPRRAAGRQEPARTGTELPPRAGTGTVLGDPGELERAVRSIERHVQNLQRRLQFSVDEASGRTVVTVIDRETDEVIRRIPSQEMLALAGRLDATTGLLLAEQA